MDVDDFLLARVGANNDAGAHWTPDRVQGHTDSIRRLVQEYRERGAAYRAAAAEGRSTTEQLEKHAAWAAFAEAVKILALPYEDHPDHQPEWRPDWRPAPPRG